jgi:ABC-type Mn2+/Zn2+ transport system permease subunit
MASVGGLYASFKLDVPTGAAIVCVLGVTLLLAVIAQKFRRTT